MKKVLIISYAFPPMAAVGVYRVIKFCKFLPQFGWQPVVLTVKTGFNYAKDEALARDLDPELKVYRSRAWDPFMWWDRRGAAKSKSVEKPDGAKKQEASAPPSPAAGSGLKRLIRQTLSTPDSSSLWIPFGTATGIRAVRKEGIDLVLSTSPPASAHVIGAQIAGLLRIPHVVDFRDLWTQNEAYDLLDRPSALKRVDSWVERKVLARSSAVTTASDKFSDSIRLHNRGLDPGRVHTITNGLDADDFRGVKFPTEKNKRFTILHLGSLYGRRDPSFFFNAVKAFIEKCPEASSQCEIKFIGNTPGAESFITDSRVRAMISFTPHVPHHEVLTQLWAADLLLLILGFGDEVAGVIPAKLFEYIATGRPILALVPEGEAKQLIDRHSPGYCVTGPDIETAVGYLTDAYSKWQRADGAPQSALRIPEEFDRRAQSRKLAEIMNAATK